MRFFRRLLELLKQTLASVRRRNFEFPVANSRKRNSYHFDFSTCVPYSRTIGVSQAFIWFTQHLEEVKRYAGTRVAIVDDEVISAANEHGIAMIFTGMRHFRH